MQMSIIAKRAADPPLFAYDPARSIAPDPNTPWTVVVIERGMASGEPSVAVVVELGQGGAVFLETSLDKFLMAASGMAQLAEQRFGWKRPDGHATLMPPAKAERRKLLEDMIAELKAWDEAGDAT